MKKHIKPHNYLLFTPGPVNVSKNVNIAMCKEDICHRETDFDHLLESVASKLLKLFEIKNTVDYQAVVITGSGTAANESILSSVVGDQAILVISNGEFGDRLFSISKIHNKNTFLLDFPWGKKLDFNKIEKILKSRKIDIIAMVHHETSSGILNSLEKIGALAKSYQAMLIVDCVSSAGAEPINMEKNNISFISASSSKAIASYPGLSFVVGKKMEFEKLKGMPAKTTYLDLYKFYHFIKTRSQTPNTPAVSLIYALEQALINLLNEEPSRRYATLKKRADILRKGMSDLGLKFLIDPKNMCSVLTMVHLPAHLSIDLIRKRLREKKIIIYEGKGVFKRNMFQVGNIGELSLGDIRFFLDSLREALGSFAQLKLTTTLLSDPTFMMDAFLDTSPNRNSLPVRPSS